MGNVGIGTTTPTWDLTVHGQLSASNYSRKTNIPVVWQGSVYDGHTPPILIPDNFTYDEYRVKTISGSCYVSVQKNDTTDLWQTAPASASNAGWTAETAGTSVTFVENDYIRVHISESKLCEGLSVNIYMTY